MTASTIPDTPIVDERDRDALETLEAIQSAIRGMEARLVVLRSVEQELSADLHDPSPLMLMHALDPTFYDDPIVKRRPGLPLAELVEAVAGRANVAEAPELAYLAPARRLVETKLAHPARRVYAHEL